MIDPDHLKRQCAAFTVGTHAELEYKRTCERLNLDPTKVEQSLADIAEYEAMGDNA